jgi:hypothetical protein
MADEDVEGGKPCLYLRVGDRRALVEDMNVHAALLSRRLRAAKSSPTGYIAPEKWSDLPRLLS